MRLARTAPIGLALLTIAGGPAVAAPSPPAASTSEAPSAVLPPRPEEPLHADYPAGASGGALVTLVLIINVDGTVRSARAVDGPEPFAAAALRASASFRFAPATRGGAPIAASIRAEIRFTAPSRDLTPKTPLSLKGAAGAAPREVLPIEVTVRGERAPGALSMSRAELRLLPGAFGDPFRAIEAMPGVTPIASGVPFFYVRGAPPGNVGYFLDGVRVPLLYHLGLGPSVVNPVMIDQVDLYPGGYPARFGRFAGARIVFGETREPADALHGEGTLRLVDAGALVEAPFADGRGSALVGGRYSYTAAILSLLQSAVDVRYWDYQARVAFSVTPRDRLSVFAFGSYDHLGQLQNGEAQTIFDTTFHRVDLRYDHRFGPETTLRQAVTLGDDLTMLDQGHSGRTRSLSARTELTHRFEGGPLLRAGIDAVLEDTALDVDPVGSNGYGVFYPPRQNLTVGAWVDAVVPVTPRLSVVPGLRVDLYGSDRVVLRFNQTRPIGVDPRLAWRLDVTPWLRFSPAIGIASQPPSFVAPTPGFSLGLYGGLQRSMQASAAVEIDLPEDIRGIVTLFHDAAWGLTDQLSVNLPSAGVYQYLSGLRARGTTTGIEILIQRKLTRRLGGFLAYTLSRTERTFERGVILDDIGRRFPLVYIPTHEPSLYDRTHVLNAALSYDFGHGYRAGARAVFYTGTPRTQPSPTALSAYPIVLDEREPPFFRLDLRLEKRWTITRRGWLSLVLEVQNATLSKETVGESCGAMSCAKVELGPVTIPSLGLEGGF